MFAFCVFVGLLSVSAPQAPKLPPMPPRAEVINHQQWADYSKTVLEVMFPTRIKLLQKIKITIADNDAILAGVYTKELVVSTGAIRFVADENEFASFLSHEFAHRMLVHRIARVTPQFMSEIETNGLWLTDWDAVRKTELEADFVSSLVSLRKHSTLSTLERAIPKYVESMTDAPSSYVSERAQTLMLQLNSIERLLKRVAPRISQSTPLPGPLPRADASIEEWEKYTKQVLHAMYPAAFDVIENTSIIIDDNSFFIYADIDVEGIKFAPALVRYVVRNKEEFAVLMGHEFAHLLFNRAYDRDVEYTKIAFSEIDLGLRAQTEADIAGTLPLVKGECYLANVLKRLSLLYGSESIPQERVRIIRLDSMCKLNY